MISALIFDFDGVLFDTEPLHYDAFNAVLPAFGITLTREMYFANFVGLTDREIIRRLLSEQKHSVTDAYTRNILDKKDKVFRAQISRGIEPLSGVRELLDQCTGRIPLTICSGAKRVEIEAILKPLGLLSKFQTIVTSDDVPASKPDPAGYLLTLGRLRAVDAKIEASSCLVVEDSVNGINAALAAGLPILAIRKPYNQDVLHQAQFVVDSLSEINEKVKGLPA